MKTVRMKIDVLNLTGKLSGRIDPRRVDATTEADIARHKAADDADAMGSHGKRKGQHRHWLAFPR
jgi:putative transcriptional regulator